MTDRPLPAPLSPVELEKLRALLHRYSTERVAAHLGVSRHLTLSAAAGLLLEPRHAQRVREALQATELQP